MDGNQASPKPLSRRSFLKTGCLAAAAVGLTVCGGAGAVVATRPDPPPVELRSFSFGQRGGDKVLIAYASATGSTVDVAATIGATLGERGFAVDVQPIVEGPSLSGYQAVLVGSPVHGAHWLPEAVDFVAASQAELNALPAALFTVHFFSRGESEGAQKRRMAYLDRVRPLVPQADFVFFGGRFDQRTTAYGLPTWLARLTPTMDVRDWDAIRTWAQALFA
jgi:menaquinone-dependent protoporphyrinogen oxidase